MKKLVVLGGGTAGTMLVNKIVHKLDRREWQITVVDKSEIHEYQAGFIFVPFGMEKPASLAKPLEKYIPGGVELIRSDIEVIEPEARRVVLTQEKRVLSYDYLVIATGSEIRPDQTEGMKDGGWRRNIFDFYTSEGAAALGKHLETWPGGRLVVNVAEMPIKCPVAPLEFVFMSDWFFQKKGMRNKVEIVFSTPLPGAFTKPKATALLDGMMEKKGIHVEAEFNISEVDAAKNVIRSYDDREIPYDLLVTIPTNMGAEVIERSGLGDELNYVPTNKHTLQSDKYPNIWVLGDASNIPTSKAGAVIHYQMDAAIENILAHMKGREMTGCFDGHSNCFIESGFGKGLLIDFNYGIEPLPGAYPIPLLGPFSLMGESVFNHWGKLFFKWMYWNIMMKGIPLPLPNEMTLMGKKMSPKEWAHYIELNEQSKGECYARRARFSKV